MSSQTVYWSKNAFASSGNQSSIGAAREAEESSTETLNSDSASITAIDAFRSSSRGGTTIRYQRCYFAFDCSDFTSSSGTITNLKFNFKGTASTTGNISNNRLVKTTAFGSNTNFSNYSPADWFESLDLNTSYSSDFTYSDGTASQAVTLNSTAISQIANNGFIQIAMLINVDFTGLGPIVDQSVNGQMNVGGNTSGNVFLTFSFAEAGYGNDVNAVPSTSISKVNEISTGNISKINAAS